MCTTIYRLASNPTLYSYTMAMTFPTVSIKTYKMRRIATVASTSALAITIVQGHIGRRPASWPCAGAMTGHFRVQQRLLPSLQRKWLLYQLTLFFYTLLHHKYFFKFVGETGSDQAPIPAHNFLTFIILKLLPKFQSLHKRLKVL